MYRALSQGCRAARHEICSPLSLSQNEGSQVSIYKTSNRAKQGRIVQFVLEGKLWESRVEWSMLWSEVTSQSFWEKQGALKGDWFTEDRRQCPGLRVGDSVSEATGRSVPWPDPELTSGWDGHFPWGTGGMGHRKGLVCR